MRRIIVASAFSFLAVALSAPAHAQLAARAVDVDAQRTRGSQQTGQLVNGDFSGNSVSPWTLYSTNGSTAGINGDEQLEIHVGPVVVPLKSARDTLAKGASADVQLFQKNLFLKGETTYLLRFDASSSEGGNLRVRVLQHGFPFENYGLKINQNIQKRMKTFELVFVTTPGDKVDARLSFLLTGFAQPGEVYLFDNISLEELDECGDGIVSGDESCDSGAGPVVADGGFEAGTPSPFWAEASTNFGTPLCNQASCGFAGALAGDWWAWFGGVLALEEGVVSQSIAVPSAATATLNFYLWLQCNGETGDFLEVTVDGAPIFTVDLTDPRCANPGYELVSLDLTPFVGSTVELAFRAITGTAGTAGNIFVDEISIDVDGCRSDCTFCGDGITNGFETCDDGNYDDSDGCTFECVADGFTFDARNASPGLRK